jgi:hypothetical protein
VQVPAERFAPVAQSRLLDGKMEPVQVIEMLATRSA